MENNLIELLVKKVQKEFSFLELDEKEILETVKEI